MYWCPFFYSTMKYNEYVQMNNEMIVANMMQDYNKSIAWREIKNQITQDPNTSLIDENIHLVLDSQNYYDIPKHFRKSSDSLNMQSNKEINLSGLSRLNISGSQQFSEYNLPLVINSLETLFPITVVDLRQESHGFINGAPVSWANVKNDANIGLTRDQVLLDEYNKLNSIKLNVPMTYYNHKNITIVPTKVEDENYLVNSKLIRYIRITVTDGKIPKDDMVDYFIELVKLQPDNTWLHFHCKQGIGRTTTFMIMYDMIKNSKNVTADDIIKRQLLLANFDESHINSFNNNERIKFLQNFYEYCRSNSDV